MRLPLYQLIRCDDAEVVSISESIRRSRLSTYARKNILAYALCERFRGSSLWSVNEPKTWMVVRSSDESHAATRRDLSELEYVDVMEAMYSIADMKDRCHAPNKCPSFKGELVWFVSMFLEADR